MKTVYTEGVSSASTIFFHTPENRIPDFFIFPFVSGIFSVMFHMKSTASATTASSSCTPNPEKESSLSMVKILSRILEMSV